MTVRNNFGLTAPIFTGQRNGFQLVGSFYLYDTVPTNIEVLVAFSGTISGNTITATGQGGIRGGVLAICSGTNHSLTFNRV
jgi:hypothetical protein